ncbi:MAG TPA: sigma-54 dependent transcriptional regulator, partial [Gammaproteobacteria bacterium]|nr:sigma-54 dependent transcriptional regulator [Gammaproteobacteria bacterium]
LRPITAADLAEARRRIAEAAPRLVLTDMRLPDGDGLGLVEWMRQQAPGIPVAVLTAYGNVETAVAALKAGAFDFLTKPLDLARLRRLVADALDLAPSASAGPSPLLGEAPSMRQLRSEIARLARSQAPVLISGESGTGKELAARLIHASSARGSRPFVPVNCGAIPAELMESEFFGHRRGSFTGAIADHAGLVASADGGTLFLDEVAELSPAMQAKLLRVIQDRAVRALGATTETAVDVRFLSATHRDLARLVAEGKFRDDLYYRIDVIRLQLPPLRERREDIPLLARSLLARIAAKEGLSTPALDESALAALAAHDYPGNVRELENVLERAFAFATCGTLGAADIRLRRDPSAGEDEAAAETTLGARLSGLRREAIEEAIAAAGGKRGEAARRLGLTARQLRYRIAQLGIETVAHSGE